MEQHQAKEARKFIRAGTIAAAVYNVNRDSKKHPQAITAADIFPGVAGKARETRDATAAEIDLFFTGVVVDQQKSTNGKVSPPRRGRRKVSRATMIDNPS